MWLLWQMVGDFIRYEGSNRKFGVTLRTQLMDCLHIIASNNLGKCSINSYRYYRCLLKWHQQVLACSTTSLGLLASLGVPLVLVLVLGLLHLSIKPRFDNTEMLCSWSLNINIAIVKKSHVILKKAFWPLLGPGDFRTVCGTYTLSTGRSLEIVKIDATKKWIPFLWSVCLIKRSFDIEFI